MKNLSQQSTDQSKYERKTAELLGDAYLASTRNSAASYRYIAVRRTALTHVLPWNFSPSRNRDNAVLVRDHGTKIPSCHSSIVAVVNDVGVDSSYGDLL